MARNVAVLLTGTARHGDLHVVVTLTKARPHGIEYALASVRVDVDGRQISCQAQASSEASALSRVVVWSIERFGAKTASIDVEQTRPARNAV